MYSYIFFIIIISVLALSSIIFALYFFGYVHKKKCKKHISFLGEPLDSCKNVKIDTKYFKLINYFEQDNKN